MTSRGDRRLSTTAQRLGERFKQLEVEMDEALAEHWKQARAYAQAYRDYKVQHAQALLQAEGTVDERKARADLASQDELEARLLAENLMQSALEAVRAKRQKISALQSLAGAYREEGGFERTKPGG